MQEPGKVHESAGATACLRCGAPHAPSDPCTPADAAARTLVFGGCAAAPPPDAGADPLVGAQVGSFRIVRMLGRGGMGTVYLAEHPVIGSRVAIKFLHESMAADAELVQRFYDEARAVNLIGHENIVGVYDLASLPSGRRYYVMELLDGETLAERLARGPLPRSVALQVLLQLCDALQCAHERGVVHRDLKPENVFLVPRRGRPDFVKLVDFGIAKLRSATGHATGGSGAIIGTPEYMAPEQCEGGPVDPRTDVYALGVMAYELLAGRRPFDSGPVQKLLLAHLREPPPPPSAFADLEPDLEAAVLRALAKAPGDRFQDMTAMAEALRPAAARLVRPPGPVPAPAAPDRRGDEAERARPAPAPAPAPARAEPELTAILRAGPVPRRLPIVELTRAGLYLRADDDLPPLFARVKVELAHASLRSPLVLAAEVVRHVTRAEAAAFRMAPGFALQLVDLAPGARAAVAALADALRREPAPTSPPPSAGGASARLDVLERRAAEGPYALLGLPPDADFPEVRRAARALREELEALRARPLAPDHATRSGALLARLDLAQGALATPAPRLAHDARAGNWRGVRRCLAAGVPDALREARRRELHEAEPARAGEARRQLACAQVARKLGNVEAARAAWEAALAADPLDAAAVEGYVAFRREQERR
ncbi:protein kinase domain-containing protein [Anaeromyxobacter sp. Red801]|uniref:protein kinase domain-containing protein n=1 Tax=Anaeromyxobacter sp. Red801 TaxID=3411632 RepID=UPI003B9EB0A7